MVETDKTSQLVLVSLSRHIRQEIKHTCSDKHDSILHDSHEGIKKFSWETVWAELMTEMPTLMKILALIIRNPEGNKPLLCLIASMLLKHYSPRVSLVQRAISVVLYGSATPKKVSYFSNLQNHEMHLLL